MARKEMAIYVEELLKKLKDGLANWWSCILMTKSIENFVKIYDSK
jgi:hypothetical protein